MSDMEPNLRSDVDLSRVFRSAHLRGLHGIRPIAQTKSFTCGPAAVATVLRYLGESATEGACAQSLKTNRVIGTTPENVLRYIRRRGLRAVAYQDTPVSLLISRVQTGKITLVDWADYGGHWVVVAGYEPYMKVIVLADPARPRSCFAAHSIERFEEHWHCDGFGRQERFRQLAILVDRYQRPEKNYGGKRLRRDQGETVPRILRYSTATRPTGYGN